MLLEVLSQNAWEIFNHLDDETRTSIIVLGLLEIINENFQGEERERVLKMIFRRGEGNENAVV